MTDTRTDTELKLEEALVQLRLASQHPLDIAVLRSCVNAFISHGRGVTFSMQTESSAVPGLTEWYRDANERLIKDPICTFFNKVRVHTIHRGTINPQSARLPVIAASPVPPTSPEEPRRYNMLTNSPLIPGLRKDVIVGPVNGEFIFWYFEEASEHLPGDSGGVFRLCRTYLTTLETFVGDWLAERARRGSAA